MAMHNVSWHTEDVVGDLSAVRLVCVDSYTDRVYRFVVPVDLLPSLTAFLNDVLATNPDSFPETLPIERAARRSR